MPWREGRGYLSGSHELCFFLEFPRGLICLFFNLNFTGRKLCLPYTYQNHLQCDMAAFLKVLSVFLSTWFSHSSALAFLQVILTLKAIPKLCQLITVDHDFELHSSCPVLYFLLMRKETVLFPGCYILVHFFVQRLEKIYNSLSSTSLPKQHSADKNEQKDFCWRKKLEKIFFVEVAAFITTVVSWTQPQDHYSLEPKKKKEKRKLSELISVKCLLFYKTTISPHMTHYTWQIHLCYENLTVLLAE